MLHLTLCVRSRVCAEAGIKLKEDQIAELRNIFDNFDNDGSGSIDADEIGKIFKAQGQPMSKLEVEELIKEVHAHALLRYRLHICAGAWRCAERSLPFSQPTAALQLSEYYS